MRRGRIIGLVAVLAVVASACGSGGSSSGSSAGGGSHRGGTLIMLSERQLGDARPGQELHRARLPVVAVRRRRPRRLPPRAGVAGTAIVPDLATAVPKPTDGGRTYVFHVRKGIRYSNGAPVRASDFATVFKRQFTVPGPANGFYDDIVGGGGVRQRARRRATCPRASSRTTPPAPSRSTSRRPIRSSWTSWRCRSRSPSPPRRRRTTWETPPIPGTGPYMWKSYNPNKVAVMVRNPYFHVVVGGRPARRKSEPDPVQLRADGRGRGDRDRERPGGLDGRRSAGRPAERDRYQVRLAGPRQRPDGHLLHGAQRQRPAVQQRQGPPGRELCASSGRRTSRSSAGRRWPSRPARCCRRTSPAITRTAPTRAIRPSGKWTAPDLAKARSLVAASGTRGARVAVVGTTDSVGKAITLQFVQDLNRIGYHATPKLLSSAIQYPYIQDSRNHVQVGYSQWFQDYPAASDFINVLLGCSYFHPNSDASPNISGFCDRSVQAQIDQALRLGETDPDAANTHVGADRPPRHRPGPDRHPVQPQAGRLRLNAPARLRVQPPGRVPVGSRLDPVTPARPPRPGRAARRRASASCGRPSPRSASAASPARGWRTSPAAPA